MPFSERRCDRPASEWPECGGFHPLGRWPAGFQCLGRGGCPTGGQIDLPEVVGAGVDEVRLQREARWIDGAIFQPVGGVVLELANDDDQLALILGNDRLYGELQRVVIDATVALVECGALGMTPSDRS